MSDIWFWLLVAVVVLGLILRYWPRKATGADVTPEEQKKRLSSEEEIEELRKSFQRPIQRGAAYVALPAPGYDVHGFWHTFGTGNRSGYATHAVALHWMLSRELKIPTQLTPHRSMDIDFEKFPSDRSEMLLGWLKEYVGHPQVLFCSYTPETSADMVDLSPGLVPYCAFEGTSVSEYVRDLCNNQEVFKRVWVVSEFVRKGLLAGGVRPEVVQVVRPPLCGGPWTMRTNEEQVESFAVRERRGELFVFGTLGTWQKRKGMHDLLRAYFTAFTRKDRVKLVVKTSAFGENLTIKKLKEKISEEVATVAKEFGGYPSETLPRLDFELGTDLTDQEVLTWLADLDCYVNPSYGEGLGIPPIWAIAQGVPLVTTSYGAVGDLFAEIKEHVGVAPGVAIDHKLQQVDIEMLSLGLMFDAATKWGVYNPKELGSAMRTMFERGRVIHSLAATYVQEAFSVPVCVEAMRPALREVITEEKRAEWAV